MQNKKPLMAKYILIAMGVFAASIIFSIIAPNGPYDGRNIL